MAATRTSIARSPPAIPSGADNTSAFFDPTVKLHHHLVADVVSALIQVFGREQRAEAVVNGFIRTRPKWGGRDRRFFAESVYESVRWWRWYWHLAGLPDAECTRPDAVTAERTWLVWTAHWLAQGGELPPFAECSSLRLDEFQARKQQPVPMAVRESIPDWLNERGAAELGADWEPMLDAMNGPADVFLRVNTLRTTVPDLQNRLRAEGIATELVEGLPSALRLLERKKFSNSPTFKEGWFEVQDAASQHVAPFLEVTPGMTVIDACAGAGGKALHLACALENRGKLLALDIRAEALDELDRRARRNGATVIQSRLIKGPELIAELAGKADRVLLDVPCSGLGVLRRNADAKWKLTAAELRRLQRRQREILSDYSVMVRPGGKIVYATCSILPSENQQPVREFLAAQAGRWVLEKELCLRPDRDGFDGFYAARLCRSGG